MDVESKLGEEEVKSLQARVTVQTSYNFWSDCWIAMNILWEFPEAPFNGMDVESTLGEVEAWSSQTRVSVRKGRNFWSDGWIAN